MSAAFQKQKHDQQRKLPRDLNEAYKGREGSLAKCSLVLPDVSEWVVYLTDCEI